MSNRKNGNNLIIVENGINNCYISSLLVALFYSSSDIYYRMLESEPSNPNFYYLQELIKLNFIEPLRKNISVTTDIINEIRNYMFMNGWKSDKYDEIIEQQDIGELYIYLSNNLNEQNSYLIKECLYDDLEEINNKSLSFIKLPLPKDNIDHKNLNLEDLLHQWLLDSNFNKNISSTKINNVPYIFPIYIDRFLNNKKNNLLIDIKYQIKPFINHDINKNVCWCIHSIICHTGKDVKNGHYYTVLLHGNKWYLFDDNSIPSISQIDMKIETLKNKIMSEVVFVIYKYDELSI